MRKINFLRLTLATLLSLMWCIPLLNAQNLPVFNYADDVPTERGQFLPAVDAWQPSYPMSSADVFSEDFNKGSAQWIVPNEGWQITNGKAEITGNQGSAESYLISPSFTVPQGKFKLKYKEKYSLESHHDFGSVWITTDDGASWRKVHTVTGVADWRDTYIDLRAYQNKTVKFAFTSKADDLTSNLLWQIDNLEIVEQSEITFKSSASNARTSAQQNDYTATLTSLNSQRFPFIFANVRVDGTTEILDESCFSIFENGVLQTENIEVLAPTIGEGLADIVFVQDNSGSTSPYQTRIINSVTDFVNALQAANIDAALGLTRFGQFANSGAPIIENGGNLSTDLDFFLTNIYSRNTDDGSVEPGFSATVASATQFAFRPGAQRIFIFIADEPANNGFGPDPTTQQQALDALQQNSITFNAVIEIASSDSEAQIRDYGTLADSTNGNTYNIAVPDFTPILNDISDVISGSYSLRYRSSNPVADGTVRNVEIRVGCDNTVVDVATGSYIPGAAPVISLTQPTLDIINTGQAIGASIPIQAEITDAVTPVVQSATLFYKSTVDTPYLSVAMTQQGSSDIWEAEIPGSAAVIPGVDFYITATDGNVTSSLPSDDPVANPFQIAVLPNIAPVINFTEIETLCAGEDLTVSATITDNTNQVERAELFYRGVGQLVYQAIALNNQGNDTYEAIVSSDNIPSEGIEYYIEAEDDFGVRTQEGTPDSPITVVISEITSVIAGDQSACDVSDNSYLQDIIVEYSNPPSGTELLVNGTSFPLISSPQTVELKLPSDGNPVDVNVSFSGSCATTYENLFTAPESCTTPDLVPTTLVLDPETVTVQAGVEVCITGTVFDQFGDPLAGVEIFTEIDGQIVGSGISDENGEVEYCFTPTESGVVTVVCYYENGDRVTAEVTVLVPILTIDVSLENGLVTIVCTVVDQFGDPFPNETITINVSGANSYDDSGQTNAEGIITFTYQAENTGTDLIVCSYSQGDVSEEVEIEDIGNGDPVPTTLVIEPDVITATVGEEVCIKGTVFDQFDNPLAGVEVFAEVNGELGGSELTDENGEVEYCFIPTEPAVYDIIGYYEGGERVPAKITIVEQSDLAVESFTLVDADTDQDIQPLIDGDVIVSDGVVQFSVRANTTSSETGSVRLELDGPITQQQLENVVPYSLFGDNPPGEYEGEILLPGQYTLTATPYTESRGQGEAGTPLTIQFEVKSSPLTVEDFTLVNAETNQDISPLADGDVIDLGQLDATLLSARANVSGGFVGSVALELNGPITQQQLENVTPYTLFGDSPPGEYRGEVLPSGQYTLTATPYTQSRGRGDIGTSLTIQFEVVDGSGSRTATAQPKLGSESFSELSFSNYGDQEFTVYPIPSNGEVHIVIPEHMKGSAKLFVYDALGRLVHSSDGRSHQEPMNLRSHGLGVYFIRLLDDKHTFSKRILIE